MAKRPTQKQLEQIKARCDRIEAEGFKIERAPIHLKKTTVGKLSAKPIGKWTPRKKKPPEV